MRKLWLVFLVTGVFLFCPSLVLAAEEITTLKEVEVTAIPLEKYLVTTSVITAKDIEVKGAKNLAEALWDVPGLNLHSGRKNNTSLDIRGVAGTDTKIFIDGVLVNPLARMTSTASVDISMFPVDNIAKIEVIKGPAPVIYGTDVKGGVILITTKSGKDYQGGKVAFSGGSYNTLNGSFAYGGGQGNFSYYLNGASERTDGFRDNADRKSNYLNTKLTWQLKDNSALTFLGGYSKTDKGIPNGVDPVDGHMLLYTRGYWPGSYNWQMKDWDKSNLTLGYQTDINKTVDYNVKVSRLTEKNTLWGYQNNAWTKSYWDSHTEGVEVQSNIRLNPANTLTLGASYSDVFWKTTDIAPYTNWLEYKDKRSGLYLQSNFIPNDKTNVTIGVRYDKDKVTDPKGDTKDKSATNPTVNLVYLLNKKDTLRVSYGKTCTFPVASQLFGGSGNPDLKPEKGETYELGLKHQFDQTLTGDLAVFQNNITDKIDRDPTTRKNVNLTSAKIKGLELELNKKFSHKLKGFVNYTYLDASSKDATGAETDLTYTPRNHINYGVNYQADQGYKFNLTGHWVDKRSTGDTGSGDNRSQVNGQTPIYKTIPSYHVVDLKVSRQVNDNQEWYLQVNNLFDKEYEEELFYPAPGRQVIVGADFKF